MKESSYFVTGTDTGIGKTVVSTILSVGRNSYYWKPIQTGASEDRDSEFVSRWHSRSQIRPETYIFQEPSSPHLAAKSEGCEIDLQNCIDAFESFDEPTVVEGAGGVLVPINSNALMIDFIGMLAIPTIVVSSTRLGTINHTLLTLEALRNRNITVAGIITVGPKNLAIEDSFRKYGNTQILGHVPQCESFCTVWFKETYELLSIPNFRREQCTNP